ncbi:MAG: hypothetical protein MR894_10060 [Akkermansia muciniphila]|nr:hypothetical protein [Akkermansia muciniphila]
MASVLPEGLGLNSGKSVRSALKNDPDGIAVMRNVKFRGKVSKEAPSLPLKYIPGTDENM